MAIGLPPFVTSAAEGIARKLARARQYAQENPRFTQSLVGGLTAQAPQGAGFFGGLQAGLGGSFGAGQRYDQMAQEREQEALKATYMQAQIDKMRQPQASTYQDTMDRLRATGDYKTAHPEADTEDWTVPMPTYGTSQSGEPLQPMRALPTELQ